MTFQLKRRRAPTAPTVSIFIDGRNAGSEAERVIVAIRAFAREQGYTLQSVVLAACDEYLDRQAKGIKV